MGEQHRTPTFPQEIIDEYAALGVDLPALFSAGHLGERMGVTIVEASADRVVGTMPVEGNTQPYGLLHGGASAVLAETLGSIGSMLHGGATKIAVGVDLNCTHHRGVRSGLVTGVATPVHRGRSTATYEIVITDEHGQAGLHRPPHLPAPRRTRHRRRLTPAPQHPPARPESAPLSGPGRPISEACEEAWRTRRVNTLTAASVP